MNMRTAFSTFWHRSLRIPYTLNIETFRTPKNPKATFVLIHGIGNTLHAWDEVVGFLPDDVRVIGIDLLGFGKSPKPAWAIYNAKTQARSVAVTLLGLRLAQQPILVGHSLGALVAVEIAKRYPLAVKEAVLCSPPFYEPEQQMKKTLASRDDLLRQLYRRVKKYPDQLQKWSPTAVKLGFANRALNITKDNIASYLAALESSIINQTSLQDVRRLRMPVTIFYGAFDPVVVSRHIVKLGKERENVTIKRLAAGHEVMGSYAKSVAVYLTAKSRG